MADSEPLSSYKEFLQTRNLEASSETLEQYSAMLQKFRLAQAAALGISLEDLHGSTA